MSNLAIPAPDVILSAREIVLKLNLSRLIDEYREAACHGWWQYQEGPPKGGMGLDSHDNCRVVARDVDDHGTGDDCWWV